jgi:hypothetical protein
MSVSTEFPLFFCVLRIGSPTLGEFAFILGGGQLASCPRRLQNESVRIYSG